MADSTKVHGTRGNSRKILQQLKIKRATIKGTITKTMNKIDALIKMDGVDGVSEVSSKYNQLKVAIKTFRDVHSKYHSALEDEWDIDESLEYFTSVETKVSDCLAKVSKWIDRQRTIVEASIAEQMSVLSEEINPEDSASNTSPRNSKVSKSSSSGSKTSSHVSSKKQERQAYLEAEIAVLRQRQSLEIEQLNMEAEYERERLLLEQKRRELQL